MIGAFAEEEIVLEIEKTYFEGLAAFCASFPGIHRKQEPGMITYATGLPLPMLNGILGAGFSGGELELKIKTAMAPFEEGGLPMMWALGPSTSKELDGCLEAQGLTLESVAPGMALDLVDLERRPLPPGLDIQVVEDMGSLEACIDITGHVFGIPEDAMGGWGDIIRGYGLGPPHRWFLGCLDGKPISASLLVQHEKVAGIYNVATLKEARGRGVGSAMTRVPLLSAKDAGYGVAVLEASEMGRPIYEKLGFKKLCEFRIFTWSPGDPGPHSIERERNQKLK
ncbi:MAG: GNAT family N-acetyltransferase [Methanomassiliicoccales archaeon]